MAPKKENTTAARVITQHKPINHHMCVPSLNRSLRRKRKNFVSAFTVDTVDCGLFVVEPVVPDADMSRDDVLLISIYDDV